VLDRHRPRPFLFEPVDRVGEPHVARPRVVAELGVQLEAAVNGAAMLPGCFDDFAFDDVGQREHHVERAARRRRRVVEGAAAELVAISTHHESLRAG
jgi:hypothetical protein